MRRMILAVAITVCGSAAAMADPPAPSIESAGSHPGEPLICHYYYHEGQVVRQAACKTAREWIRIRLQQQADINQFELRSYSIQK